MLGLAAGNSCRCLAWLLGTRGGTRIAEGEGHKAIEALKQPRIFSALFLTVRKRCLSISVISARIFFERSGSALVASRSGVEQSNVGSK